MNKFCWHDWSKWSELLDTDVYWVKVQSRKCVKCGKIKHRRAAFSLLGTVAVQTQKVNGALGDKS